MLLWPFNKYPGTDYETFNWEWILKTVKDYTEKVDDFIESITNSWDTFRNYINHEIAEMHRKFAIYVNVTEEALNTGAIADGAVTKPKIDPDFLMEIENDYVTPEMFGAAGDGITDDTVPVQDALSSGHNVLFRNTYKITDTCEVNDNIKVFGNGTINYVGSNFSAHDNIILYYDGATTVDVDGLNFSIDFTNKSQVNSAGRTYAIWVRAKEQIEYVNITNCIYTNKYGYVKAVQKMFEGVIWIGTYANTMDVPAYPSVKYVNVSDNIFNNVTGRGIYTTDCGEVKICNNIMNNIGENDGYSNENFTYAIRSLSNVFNYIVNNKLTFSDKESSPVHCATIVVSYNDEYLNKSGITYILNNTIDATKFTPNGNANSKCRIINCNTDLAVISKNVVYLAEDNDACHFVFTNNDTTHLTLSDSHFIISENVVYNCIASNIAPDTSNYTAPSVELINNTFYGKSQINNIYIRSGNTNFDEYLCHNNTTVYESEMFKNVTVWSTNPTKQLDESFYRLTLTNANIGNYITGNTLNIPSYLYNVVSVSASSITNGFNIRNILINGEVPAEGTTILVVNTGDGNSDCVITSNTSGDGGIRAGANFTFGTHDSFKYMYLAGFWRKA